MDCPECRRAHLHVLNVVFVGAHGFPLVCPECMNAFYMTNGIVCEGEYLPDKPTFRLEPNFKENVKDFPLTGADLAELPLLTNFMKKMLH